MHREIKFRCWDKVAKCFESKMGLYFDNGKLGDFSQCFHNEAGDIGEYYVLTQYTGLKDSDGVEIYEGDIVRETWDEYDLYGYGDTFKPQEKEEVYAVEFKNGKFVFQKQTNEQNAIENFKRVVIGNVFQNEDLSES